jgi:hypothetical protein
VIIGIASTKKSKPSLKQPGRPSPNPSLPPKPGPSLSQNPSLPLDPSDLATWGAYNHGPSWIIPPEHFNAPAPGANPAPQAKEAHLQEDKDDGRQGGDGGEEEAHPADPAYVPRPVQQPAIPGLKNPTPRPPTRQPAP